MDFGEKKYFLYTKAYPEGMELAGEVFYVGKGTSKARIAFHDWEARTSCACEKCTVIRSIFSKGLKPVDSIVYETLDEDEAYAVEELAIRYAYTQKYLVNKVHVSRSKPKQQIKRNSVLNFTDIRLTFGYLDADFAETITMEEVQEGKKLEPDQKSLTLEAYKLGWFFLSSGELSTENEEIILCWAKIRMEEIE